MLIDPDLEEIVSGQRGMVRGIDACVKAQCLVSAVVLIYSTIDALSALTRPVKQAETDNAVFTAWVTKYIDPENKLGCTAIDLYGARCGVVHNYGSDSRKRREGKAKALIYKWRYGPNPDPHRKVPLPKDAMTLIVEDLRDALEQGIHSFLAAMEKDPELKTMVDHHRRELLCYKPWTAISIHVAA